MQGVVLRCLRIGFERQRQTLIILKSSPHQVAKP